MNNHPLRFAFSTKITMSDTLSLFQAECRQYMVNTWLQEHYSWVHSFNTEAGGSFLHLKCIAVSTAHGLVLAHLRAVEDDSINLVLVIGRDAHERIVVTCREPNQGELDQCSAAPMRNSLLLASKVMVTTRLYTDIPKDSTRNRELALKWMMRYTQTAVEKNCWNLPASYTFLLKEVLDDDEQIAVLRIAETGDEITLALGHYRLEHVIFCSL
jgi:hypothetical protein